MHLRERKKNHIYILVPPRENTIGWKIWAHRTLNGCYSSPVEIGAFKVDQGFTSSSMRAKARGFENTSLSAGFSRIFLNIEDPEISQGRAEIPLDDQFLYLKLQPYLSTTDAYAPNTYTNILIVPSVSLFSREMPYLPIGGNAPAISATPNAVPTNNFLSISLPRQSLFFSISNTSSADSLLFTTDKGSPVVTYPPGYESSTTDAGVSEIYVASANGNVVPFIINATMKGVR